VFDILHDFWSWKAENISVLIFGLEQLSLGQKSLMNNGFDGSWEVSMQYVGSVG
jgi:hypothetical protein